jgi:hypothetical protein
MLHLKSNELPTLSFREHDMLNLIWPIGGHDMLNLKLAFEGHDMLSFFGVAIC